MHGKHYSLYRNHTSLDSIRINIMWIRVRRKNTTTSMTVAGPCCNWSLDGMEGASKDGWSRSLRSPFAQAPRSICGAGINPAANRQGDRVSGRCMSLLGPGCVKTPTLFYNVEFSSQFRG